MRLKVLTALALVWCLGSASSSSSRKKRYLIFPTNSVLTLSGCLAKGGIILQPPAFVFTFDFDLLFQLPNTTRVWTGLGPYKTLRKEKRDLYNGLEDILERQGFNGRACVLRTICEARQILGEGGTLMEDILHALFSLEPKDDDGSNEVDSELKEHDDAHTLGVSRYACHQLYSECPISLLHYALW
ncbi:uncharacterized protein LOC132205281 [Neocloeon triangulifer]|uniref:uncharacterized protein LOC132205281 n=1 Tax=Neocloeon triangulifer TaxID=2078957 RepID=UPI00286F82A6|nr:uncharacterized protein LOC132205281 [Neocloeon triangulifer]